MEAEHNLLNPGHRRSLVLPRAILLIILIVAAFGCGPQADRPWRAREARPGAWNVLLISLDTVRPDRLRACGGTRVPTPGLDRVLGDGFLFRQMVTPAPVTLAAHASLFTGQNPWRHGVRENTEFALPSGASTLAGCFRQCGYETAAFVASFVLGARFGLAQGFDSYSDRLDGPEAGLGPGTVEIRGGIEATRAGRWIRDYADRRKSGATARPFFLFVHFYDAHAPYQAPSPFAEMYPDRPYDGELAYVDHCVGQVLDALEETGEASRTLIWVVSDHGESLGEHGEATHELFIYDATVRVVSLLKTPPAGGRFEAGRPRLVIDRQAGLIDVAPTLCALAGIPDRLPDQDGRSLLPALEGSRMPEDPLYCETLSPFISYHWAPLRGVRTREWKYIQAPAPELYNLGQDPGELKNLAADQPEEAARLAAILQTLEGPQAGAGAAASRAPTPEELERLRSLGYITTGAEPAGASTAPGPSGTRALPDPKTMVDFFNGQYEQAKGLLYAGRFEEAAAAFRRALTVDPLNNSILLYLAGALRQAGHPAEAARSYREAVRIEPHSPRGFFGWGESLLAEGNADSAAWAFRKSVELLPGSPDGWSSLGLAEWLAGRRENAATAFRTARSNGADPVPVEESLVWIYRESGDAARAQEHLEALAHLLGTSEEEAERRLPDRASLQHRARPEGSS